MSGDAKDVLDERKIFGIGTALDEWQQWPALGHIATTSAEALLPEGRRAVVVAPHPDDEILGCGGLLQQWAMLGRTLLIVSVTDGTGSHSGSTQWPADRLAVARPAESQRALSRLGLAEIPVIRLRLTDTRVADEAKTLRNRLMELLLDDDVLVTTWRGDGHPDHEATGHVCAQLATDRHLRLLELPIWMWHWATPDDSRVPWHCAQRLAISEAQLARKRQAMTQHVSQCQGDLSTGQPPVLSAHTVERLMQRHEIVFCDERPSHNELTTAPSS